MKPKFRLALEARLSARSATMSGAKPKWMPSWRRSKKRGRRSPILRTMHSGAATRARSRTPIGMSGKWLGIPIGNFPTNRKPVSRGADSWESFLQGQVSTYEASRLILFLRNLPRPLVARRNVPSPCDPPRSGAEQRRVVGITPQCIRIGIFNAIPSSFSPKSGCRAKLKKKIQQSIQSCTYK